jgi:hypothetical protein
MTDIIPIEAYRDIPMVLRVRSKGCIGAAIRIIERAVVVSCGAGAQKLMREYVIQAADSRINPN